MTTYFTLYQCPIGNLRLRASDLGLIAVDHVNQQERTEQDWIQQPDHPILLQATEQLDQYFAKKRQEFTIPLAPQGTKFQLQVWSELQQIPFGETISYAELANRIHNPKAVRAVGSANGKNPLSIFIPCHRVIGKNGTLTGYAGGLKVKEILLRHEANELF